MWPWGHVAVGYLVYSVLVHLSGESPRDYPTLALVFGTQFPNLVDKPLAWTLEILPNGRSLTHSLFTAIGIIVVLRLLLHRYDHGREANAFGIGYLLHLVGDAVGPLLSGEYYYLGFLAWPLVPPIEYGEKSFLSELSSLELSMFSSVEAAVFLVVVGLWILDGAPGLRPLFSALNRVYGWLSAS
jgi:membrane-bound metal-dependent hydrolase YbcI (DUF457 family)